MNDQNKSFSPSATEIEIFARDAMGAGPDHDCTTGGEHPSKCPPWSVSADIARDEVPVNAGPRLPSALVPPEPEVPLTITRTGETSSIAAAIRDEIRKLTDVEVLTLDLLNDICRIAREGRDLVAIRNPIARFDAKAQGIAFKEHLPPSMGSWDCEPSDCGYVSGYGQITNGNYPHWKGPAVRGAADAYQRRILDALRDSPLAKAVKAELLDLTATSPFGPSELLQVEQLAEHAHRVLMAALGLEDEPDLDRGPVRKRPSFVNASAAYYSGPNPGPYGVGGAMSPSSSEETWGAKAIRELAALTGGKNEKDEGLSLEALVESLAVARDHGLDDVATKIQAKIDATLGEG